jgi:hypothetical protein
MPRIKLKSGTTVLFTGGNGEGGNDGREIELQEGTTHIQWRYVGDTTWIDLVALADITGAQGPMGEVPVTQTFLPDTISTIIGGFISGDANSIKTFNDGQTYQVQEVTGVPGFDLQVVFSGITNFNKLQLNLAYTNTSSHFVTVDLLNRVTAQWDTIGFFNGLNGFTQFNLSVIDDGAYILGGEVQMRLYHVTTGYAGHSIQVDYVALQQALQGPQGPQGVQGGKGDKGDTGNNGTDGSNGKQIEIQKGATYIQWRFVGDPSWIDLIALTTIKGDKGDKGDQGDQGAQGGAGAQGNAGANGITYTWRNGSSVPAGGLGIDGDYYLKTDTGDVYFKASGTWSIVANIKGADGAGGGITRVAIAGATYNAVQTSGAVFLDVSYAGQCTITLPTAVGNNAIFYIANNSGFDVIIDPIGSETINQDTALIIQLKHSSVALLSTGSEWRIM